MKTRFLALAALVLGLASCQTEPEGLDVNVGGEVDTVVTVAIPETETRANSALGAFDNVVASEDYTIRYIFQVFYQGNESNADRQVIYSDGKSVSFPVRLVSGRHYNFVAWADVVPQTTDMVLGALTTEEDTTESDYHYNTADLKAVKLNNTWEAMDETRDAFTDYFNTEFDGDKKPYNGSKSINLVLTRPFAKLRIITTDMVELGHFDIMPDNAVVSYTTKFHESFNALNATYGAETVEKEHTYEIADYADQSGANKVLFTDYFFADDSDVVKFTMAVNEENGDLIKFNEFTTDIPVKRNFLTTIKGNILTDGNNITVEVENGFENKDNTTDAPYYQQTISSADEFYKALENGGEYIVISDFLINYAYVPAAQRTATIDAPVTTLINLNGMTITVDNDTTDAFVTLNGGSLHIAGEGTIEGNGKLIEGDVVVTGGAEIDSNVADAKTGLDALVYICENGGEFTFTEDITAADVVWVSTNNPVVINGNDKTFYTSANRAIRVAKSNANLTVNDLNISSSAVMTYPNDVRGISIDPSLSEVQMTLNNCSIDFTDKTTNDWTYAVNVSGSGTGHKVTINGGTYEGANVVNVHGAKNTIVVKNATLTSLYPNSDLYYGACIWVLQNMESSVYAEGNTFNGSNAIAFNLGTGTALEEKNNINNTKYLDNGTYYVASAQRLQEAVNSTKSDIKIEFIGDLNGDVTIIQKQGVKITIDGADYKYNGSIKVHSNSNYYADAALTIKNVNFETSAASINVIEALENGSERYSQNITVENCTFTATGDAVNTSVAVQVKATRGVTVTGCTAIDMHSLIQAQSCDTGDVKVINSTVNGKNGVAFKQVKSATVEGTTINALEYGIRYDGNIDNYGIVVKDNNVTANQPLIVRKMTGKNNTITLEGANTLTPATLNDYQIVVTNGSDDVAYVVPTGTYTLTGADDFFVFPSVATVNNAEELANAFAKNITFITLAADIDLANVAWTPAGTSEKPWYGIFDGNNKKISNLTIDGVQYAALIAYSGANSVVKNLTLENVAINSNKHAAGVVCVAEDGLTLENIKVSGNIVAASYAGGIMHNGANATIKGCENSANVSAQRVGGIASWVTVGAKIENVVNNGTITGAVGASGIAHGFAGSIKNAVNNGNISSANYEAAAGIAGVQKAASTYEYCYNYGNVTTTFDDANASAAGILGQSAGSASTLKYCANYGTITAEQSFAAGIAYSLYGTINASYCYNNGAVNGADGAGAIAPKAQFGSGDKASYCLNAGVVTSAGNVYQGSNNNTSCYYYNNGVLYNVVGNTVADANSALSALNGGADSNFFEVENGVITVK